MRRSLHKCLFINTEGTCFIGEWLPKHVGIPIAEHGERSYYMLEVHYNNPSQRKVIDSSGVRLHFTSKLRSQEAGILVTGVAVSPLHLVPPKQKEYATAGYCTPHCTNTVIKESAIVFIQFLSCHREDATNVKLKTGHCHLRELLLLLSVLYNNCQYVLQNVYISNLLIHTLEWFFSRCRENIYAKRGAGC